MAKQRSLAKRRPETYKRKIPADLAAVFGRREIWKSLRKVEGATLEAKGERLTAQLDELFTRARQEAEPGAVSARFVNELDLILRGKPAGIQTERLAAHHVEPLLKRHRALILATEAEELSAMSADDMAERAAELRQAEAQLRAATVVGDDSAVDETAQTLLRAEGIAAVRSSPEYKTLVAQLLAADLQVVLDQRARLNGDPHVPPNIPEAVRDRARLVDLIDEWVSQNCPVPTTVRAVRAIIREFEAFAGNLPLVAITRKEAVEFARHLVAKGQARKTVQKKIHLLGAVYGPALEEGRHGLTSCPFRGLKAASKRQEAKKSRRKSRRAFRSEELQALFNSPVYRNDFRPKGGDGEAIFWLPLMGTFTGAREEELAQLRVFDVVRHNNTWVLRFVDEGDLQLKNPNSYRWVPVHSELLRCGFLQYFAHVKEAGHTQLFPMMKRGSNGKFSDAFSKCFNRYLDKKVGIDDPAVVFHSLRGTFKQQCLVCGIPSDVRDALAGHSVKSDVARDYEVDEAGLYPLPTLVSAMSTLRYDEVDLTHLHVCDGEGNLLDSDRVETSS